MNRYIAPSILAADFNNLERDVSLINESNATWLHCDIMDGVYVPNISFGIPVVEALSKISEKPLDVHLMIVEPEKYVDRFCNVRPDFLTVHYEACKHLNRTVNHIKENGVKAGVSVNPHTPVELLTEIISEVDLVLIMSVNPGFGGQSFIKGSLRKIEKARTLITTSGSRALIQVDGGITTKNAGKIFAAGADILVAGTSVFHSSDPKKAIDDMLNS
ncbi:MAG: ribulose-phosphate 3-epimerase [Bacteroidales bacterium]|nr:ribulose-phosphate 3-epimerase [Bacteroidales bacterium]